MAVAVAAVVAVAEELGVHGEVVEAEVVVAEEAAAVVDEVAKGA